MQALSNIVHLAKIFRDFKGRKEIVSSLPIRLWVESSNACNLRCVMCPNKDMPAAEKGNMSLDLFRSIVDQVKGSVSDIYLHHRGEPLLNPALYDMIAYAHRAGIRTRFHSNGCLLDENRARKLIEAAPELVSFSVDGFDREAYESIRIGAEYEQTVKNIIRFLEMRKALKKKRPYVVVERINFRQTPPGETPEKIKQYTRRFLEAGLDEVIAKEEYVWAEESAPEPEGACSYSRCTFPWYAMVICWDGTVTPCPQDFNAAMFMGNAARQTLSEIWNGPAYRDLRRRLNTDIPSLALCHKCDRLRRKTVGGVPLQYMMTFLVDHLVGYNRLRRVLGTHERN